MANNMALVGLVIKRRLKRKGYGKMAKGRNGFIFNFFLIL